MSRARGDGTDTHPRGLCLYPNGCSGCDDYVHPQPPIKHPSQQEDQDWHMELAKVATELNISDTRQRLHRALSMAQRAAGQSNWDSFNQWMALAITLSEKLGAPK